MSPPSRPTPPTPGAALAVLTGPTASGKTALSLRVARAAGAEVLSMDSMLVYRGLDVGTAKPDAAERAAVPHHLVDLVDPEREFTVQAWLAAAERALEDVRARGRRALFVGGTPFYLQALVAGLFEGPPADPVLRAGLEARFEREGAQALFAELEAVDPVSAARLHPNDRRRVVRALEVWHQTGRPLAGWQRQWGWSAGEAPARRAARIVSLVLPPEELERRIRARAQAMLARGWVQEARALEARGGLGPTARQALGYAEVLELAAGRCTTEQALERIVVRTRRFARKQRTWLRRFVDRVEVVAPRAGNEQDMQRAASETLAALAW